MKTKIILLIFMFSPPLLYGQQKSATSRQPVNTSSQGSSSVRPVNSATTNATPRTSTPTYNRPQATTPVTNNPVYNSKPKTYTSPNTSQTNNVQVGGTSSSSHYSATQAVNSQFLVNMQHAKPDLSVIYKYIDFLPWDNARLRDNPPSSSTDTPSGVDEYKPVLLDAGNPPVSPEPVYSPEWDYYLAHLNEDEKVEEYSANLNHDLNQTSCNMYIWRIANMLNCYAFMIDFGFSTLDSCDDFSATIRIKYQSQVYYYYDSLASDNNKHHVVFTVQKCEVTPGIRNITLVDDFFTNFILLNEQYCHDHLRNRYRYLRNIYR